MAKVILNAFSLNMLGSFPASVEAEEISVARAVEEAAVGTSAVGHADTAAVFSAVLGLPILAARVNVTLAKGDVALVGQYRGPRLPEGATTLPAGATIQWLLVRVGLVALPGDREEPP